VSPKGAVIFDHRHNADERANPSVLLGHVDFALVLHLVGVLSWPPLLEDRFAVRRAAA